MTKKVHKLDIPLEIDFYIIGIVCNESDYRLCWQINSKLETNLTKDEDIVISQKHNQSLFSLFSFEDEELFLKYNLIKNKNQKSFFIPEEKNYDYFLKISGELTDSEVEIIVASIRSIPEVNIAKNISPIEIKSINNFLF
jgi:hypothetical protein